MTDTIGPYEMNSIVTGDARELARSIPDESIDLVFTDPVYDRIDDYRWLAETAARVLRPNGALLTWFATGLLEDTCKAITPWLNYRWLLSTVIMGPGMMYGRLSVSAARCLWYDKNGLSKLRRIVSDASAKRRTTAYWNNSNSNWAKKNGGKVNWGKCHSFTTRMIEALSPAGGIVFDPFVGGGTVAEFSTILKRNYLAFEIDPVTADLARQRVANTQPPLPLVMPTQGELL